MLFRFILKLSISIILGSYFFLNYNKKINKTFWVLSVLQKFLMIKQEVSKILSKVISKNVEINLFKYLPLTI